VSRSPFEWTGTCGLGGLIVGFLLRGSVFGLDDVSRDLGQAI